MNWITAQVVGGVGRYGAVSMILALMEGAGIGYLANVNPLAAASVPRTAMRHLLAGSVFESFNFSSYKIWLWHYLNT